MEETKLQYLKVIEKSKKVFNDKNADYGSSWRILRVSSFVDQIHIKAQRIRNLQINKDQKVSLPWPPKFPNPWHKNGLRVSAFTSACSVISKSGMS